MLQYQKYLIKDNDQFDPEFFPFVIEDMKLIREQTDHVLPIFKSEIILFFLKNHALEKEWSNTNPELTNLVNSGSLPTANIESLFDSCRGKPLFRQQMEEFFTKEFSE